MNLENITKQVCELCQEVGKFIKAEQSNITAKDIEVKDMNSFVSYVDKQAEEQLVAGLKRILPEAGFITEEGTIAYTANTHNWIVDPLDGTTNFLHGLPVYAISIGLRENNEMVSGVILELGNNELFYAWKNGGACMNGQIIKVKDSTKLEDTLLATGFPYYDYTRLPKYMNLLADCFQKTRGLRRFGSAATDLAYVACGRFDGFFEYGLNAWDVAAGAVIVREAGGEASAFFDENDFLFDREILAGSKAIMPELKELVQKHMK